ncbi:sunset domain-containing protein [Arthrobacter sp. KN11-1C]|uniref:sunset domain-containing protein n=1 Tax=Arthrobacter sp. KN11-1C TaxID=3445774 RepID=UPI003FA0EBE2
MDWLIWVIVIVLIVAIVWWLLSRNSAKSSAGATASSSPSPTAASPQMDVTSAALTGSAPLVAATAAADQGPAESRTAAPEHEPEPEPATEAGDVDDWERLAPLLETEAAAPAEAAAAETPVEEPAIEEPTLSEPVLSEAAVSEVAVSEVAAPPGPEPELEGGVTADDVAVADAGPSVAVDTGVPASSATEPATPEQLADSAEWEATWSEGGTAAAPAPIHHREYTDAHAPTLPGAESAAAEAVDAAADSAGASPLGGHLAAEQPYGEGSAAAGADGSGPDDYTVKGNADTMTYHDEDSPSYDEVKAEVWFVSSAHAEAAGFRPPRRNRR